MKYIEINYLLETREVCEFISKYSLNLYMMENIIYLISNCYIIEIYGFTIEKHFYFEIYTYDLKKYSNVGRLLSKNDLGEVRKIYKDVVLSRKNIINTNKSESYFFAYFELMDRFLYDFLKCDFSKYKSCFTENSEIKETQLKEIIKSYRTSSNSRTN